MHSILIELFGYLQSAARYKWLALICAWFLSLAGWLYVLHMPDEFKAEARIYVDTRSVLQPLLSGLAIRPDISGQIRLMSKLMLSRPNLEKVARMTDLDLGVQDDKSREKLIQRLQASMSISGGDNNLFTISSFDASAKMAKKIVQSLLTIFVEQTLGESREDSSSAQKFLDQQIKEDEDRLQKAEMEREQFRREHYGFLPGQGGDLYSQLNALAELTEEARMTAQDAANRRDELQRQLENQESTFTDFPATESATPLDSRIQTMQIKLDELLVRYTPAHPDVIALKKRIVDLENQKQNESQIDSKTNENPAPAAGEENPVYQQMKLSLSEAEANLASLNSRVKAYEEKSEKLKQQMDERLKVETQLQGLTRDYEAIKNNYSALLHSRETARLSKSVEQNSDSVKFRIVDPPQVPLKPAAPNRILLSSAVLLASLLVSLGLAIFMSLLRPTFVSIKTLREITQLPVLGSVAMNWIPASQFKKRIEFIRFSAALCSLCVVYLGVLWAAINGIQLGRGLFP